nr:unnamed protein product [Callosobruchus analis]
MTEYWLISAPDGFVEQVTRKVAQYLGEVLEDQRDKLHENLMANNSKCIF